MKTAKSYIFGSTLIIFVILYLLFRNIDSQFLSPDGKPQDRGEADHGAHSPIGITSDDNGKAVGQPSKLNHRAGDSRAQSRSKKLPYIVLSPTMDQSERRALLADMMAQKGLEGLEGLLLHYGNLPGETNLPFWLMIDLKETVAKAYFQDQLGSASQLLEVLGSGYGNPHRVVEEICETFVNVDHPDKAFSELLETPPKIATFSYKFLFSRAAHLIGPAKAMAQVDQFESSEVSKMARESIFESWLTLDPDQAVQYVYSLPEDNWFRAKSPRIIVHYVANREDYEAAQLWIETIKDPVMAESVRKDLRAIQRAQKQKE